MRNYNMKLSKTFSMALAGTVALVCLVVVAQAQIVNVDTEDEIVEEFCDELGELKAETLRIIDSLNAELDDALFTFSACNVLRPTAKGSVKCIVEYERSAAKVQRKKSAACEHYIKGVIKDLKDAQKAARAEGVLMEFNDDPRVSEKLQEVVEFHGLCVSGGIGGDA